MTVLKQDDVEAEAANAVIAFIARVLYAFVGGAFALLVATYIAGLPNEPAREVAVLVGGAAYIAHEASRAVVQALNRAYQRVLVVVIRNNNGE